MADKTSIKSTAQEFLDIHDIVNNTIILKNGTCSIVLTLNAMNFDLLAEQEQDAVIYTYAALLNSLNYPIQINIQSKTKDITSYLKLLDDQQQKTTDKRRRLLIGQYRQFVSELITQRNVLDKKFYVTIPTTALEMGLLTTQGLLPGNKGFDINTIEKTTILEKAASILEPRRDHLISQFARIGLVARQLNTQEIIQVFYNNYNPEAAEGQQITNSNNYITPLVRARMNGGIMNDLNQGSALGAQPVQPEPPAPAQPAVVPEPQAPVVDQATAQAAIQEEPAPLNSPTPVIPAAPVTNTAIPSPVMPTPVVPDQPGVQPPTQNFSPMPGLAQEPVNPGEEKGQATTPPTQL
jgi:hypothetical protein